MNDKKPGVSEGKLKLMHATLIMHDDHAAPPAAVTWLQ
jgi:hypothetical protein